MITIENPSKRFVLRAGPQQFLGLIGSSRAGKSTQLRMIRDNCLAVGGSIRVGDVVVAKARCVVIAGVFHAKAAREGVCGRLIDEAVFLPKAAA